MTKTIFLDTTILGLVVQTPGRPEADACRLWVSDCVREGSRIVVPEIVDYELRRELLRAGKSAAIARLDAFLSAYEDKVSAHQHSGYAQGR